MESVNLFGMMEPPPNDVFISLQPGRMHGSKGRVCLKERTFRFTKTKIDVTCNVDFDVTSIFVFVKQELMDRLEHSY